MEDAGLTLPYLLFSSGVIKYMSKKHYTIKNALGGCFCKKCLCWSNQPDGLIEDECKSTNREAKANRKLLPTQPQDK